MGAHFIPTTVANIRGPRCRLHHFYRVQYGVHWKGFQPRERKWVNHKCMTSEAKGRTLFSWVVVCIVDHTLGLPMECHNIHLSTFFYQNL